MDCYTLVPQYGALGCLISFPHIVLRLLWWREMHTSTTYPYVFVSDPFGRRTTRVSYPSSTHRPPRPHGTGYSNKIYFSCQNLTTCRLYIYMYIYCIQIAGRTFVRSVLVPQVENWTSPGSLLNQPARLGIYFFFLSLSHVRSLSEPVFRWPPYRVPRKERHRNSLLIRFVTQFRHLSLTGHLRHSTAWKKKKKLPDRFNWIKPVTR